MSRLRLVLFFTALASADTVLAIGGLAQFSGQLANLQQLLGFGSTNHVNIPSSDIINQNGKIYGDLSKDYQYYADPKNVPDYIKALEPRRMLKGGGGRGGGGRGGGGGGGGRGGGVGGVGVSGLKAAKGAGPSLQYSNRLLGPRYEKYNCATPSCTAVVLPLAFIALYPIGDMRSNFPEIFLPQWEDAKKGKGVQKWNQLTWNQDLYYSTFFGGSHGAPFDDLPELQDDYRNVKVKKIIIYGEGTRLVGWKFQYDKTGLQHGGDLQPKEGTTKELELYDDEFVVSAIFSSCKKGGFFTLKKTRLCSAAFSTNKGRIVDFASERLGKKPTATYIAPEGHAIIGFYGMQGDKVDEVGVISRKQAVKAQKVPLELASFTRIDPAGGTNFDAYYSSDQIGEYEAYHDPFDNLKMLPEDYRIAKIKKITIYAHLQQNSAEKEPYSSVCGIEFHYDDANSIVNGARDTISKAVELAGDEFIKGVEFSSCQEPEAFCGAKFTTNKGKAVEIVPMNRVIDKVLAFVVPKGYEMKGLYGQQGGYRISTAGIVIVNQEAKLTT